MWAAPSNKLGAQTEKNGRKRKAASTDIHDRINTSKDYGLKPLKPWAKTRPFSFKLFMPGILSQQQNV
jgi:hypothetical protein